MVGYLGDRLSSGVHSGGPLIVDHKLVVSVEYYKYVYGNENLFTFVISFTSRVTWKDGDPFMA
jgi:hypothetical protein